MWASAVAQQLGLRGDTVRVNHGDDWRAWAVELLRLPQIRANVTPRPDNFASWREWANAFNQAVRY